MAGGAKSLCISSALIKMDILSNFITLKVVLLGGGEETNYFTLRLYVKDNVNLMSLLKITN